MKRDAQYRALRLRVLAEKTVEEFVEVSLDVRELDAETRTALLDEILAMTKASSALAQACQRREPDLVPALAVFDDPRALAVVTKLAKHKVVAIAERARWALELRVKRALRLADRAKDSPPARKRPAAPTPRAYRALADGGFFDDGRDRCERIAAGKYLWLHDVEWLGLDSMKLRGDGLLPFARNTAGELWCFEREAVWFIDETGAKHLRADDFAGWLRDRLLDLFTWNADANIARAFGAIGDIVARHVRGDDDRLRIRAIASRAPRTMRSGEIAVMTPSERQQLG